MKELKLRGRRRPRAAALAAVPEEHFAEVVEMIQASRLAGEAPAAPSPSLLLKVADEAGTGVTIYGQEKGAQELITGRIRLA